MIQSLPILNNSVPISGQFVTNCRTDEIGPKHKPRRQYRTNLELPLYPQHIKLDWHCIGSALAPIGKSSANPKPFTRPFVPITQEQVLYKGWSLVFSEDEFKANFQVPPKTQICKSLQFVSNLSQSWPIRCQTSANQAPILCTPIHTPILSKSTAKTCFWSIVNPLPFIVTFLQSMSILLN